MIIRILKRFLSIFLLGILSNPFVFGQNKTDTYISGYLSIDDTWDSKIYLSHIPTFDDMYVMSNEMIIARTGIDSHGYFKFSLDFLPPGENLYRLHIIKKGDTPATLIIGGRDENHLFFLVNKFSNIKLISKSPYPPFKDVIYENSRENKSFQQITNLVYVADSISAVSTAAKRSLVEKKLQEDLLTIADTSSNLLVSLYAIYKSKFESNYFSNETFYNSYRKRWKNQDNVYLKNFSEQLPQSQDTTSLKADIFIVIAIVFVFSITAFFLGKNGLKRNKKIERLSVQERKIHELLQKGATNQEISSHFNIGLSTVKSHVSSILSKLKVKSRKEIYEK